MYVDKWGRKITLWLTRILMIIDIALVMAMAVVYGCSDNTIGKGFAIAFIFCFTVM
jgi:hypothetical protein